MPFKMISLFPINMITDRPQGRDDLRTQRKETGRKRGGQEGATEYITKGSQCVKCLPFGGNVLVTIFLLSLEVLELFSVRKAFLFVIKDGKGKYI